MAADGSRLARLRIEEPHRDVLYTLPAHSGPRIAVRLDDDFHVFERRAALSSKSSQRLPRYKPGPAGIRWPTDWSPDGKTLAGFTSPPGMQVVVFTFSSSEYTTIGPGAQPRCLADGKRLIFTAVNGQELVLYDPAQKQPIVILSAKPDSLGTPAISPDGQWLYFAHGGETRAVWLADL